MTWHFYRVADGRFTGQAYDGPAAYLAENIPPGCAAAAGVTDWRRQRMDDRGDLVECEPEPEPRSVRNAEIASQIRAIEAQQARPVRALLLNPNDQTARERLAALEAEIDSLRPQLR